MKPDRRPYLLPALAFSTLILVWSVIALLGDWGTHVFPSPAAVAASLWQLTLDGTLLQHTVASLFRVTVGFYLAILLGIPLGILLGRWTSARQFINPVIHFLRPISPLAWIPLAMLWLGIGDPPAIFLIFLASFFPLAVSTTIAVTTIQPTYFQVAANFNFSRFETMTLVILPAITPAVVTALRISINIAWLVVVAAEMIAVKSGLGYLILDSRNALRMDMVMAGMIVIGVIGLLLDMMMKRLSRLESTLWAVYSR